MSKNRSFFRIVVAIVETLGSLSKSRRHKLKSVKDAVVVLTRMDTVIVLFVISLVISNLVLLDGVVILNTLTINITIVRVGIS